MQRMYETCFKEWYTDQPWARLFLTCAVIPCTAGSETATGARLGQSLAIICLFLFELKIVSFLLGATVAWSVVFVYRSCVCVDATGVEFRAHWAQRTCQMWWDVKLIWIFFLRGVLFMKSDDRCLLLEARDLWTSKKNDFISWYSTRIASENDSGWDF